MSVTLFSPFKKKKPQKKHIESCKTLISMMGARHVKLYTEVLYRDVNIDIKENISV